VQIKESLITQDILDSTNICYFGGTVEEKDTLTLKRLLFRATRGRAILNTFSLEIDAEDIMRGENFHNENIGYIVLVEDNGPLRKVVERVCQSFCTESNKVFMINPRSV
jgi:hypothetical protein